MATKINFSEIFHPWVFLLSIAAGFLGVYVLAPEPIIIIRYPTPQNAEQEVYTDKTGQCYRYRAKTVSCPADPRAIQRVRIVA